MFPVNKGTDCWISYEPYSRLTCVAPDASVLRLSGGKRTKAVVCDKLIGALAVAQNIDFSLLTWPPRFEQAGCNPSREKRSCKEQGVVGLDCRLAARRAADADALLVARRTLEREELPSFTVTTLLSESVKRT